jgi:hypothetical protein
MPDPGAYLPALGIALLALVLLWFALGTGLNVRRGNRILQWLQDGLPSLGPRATLRWLGSSVAVLGIVDPAPPFNAAEILVVLEPRDLGALWAIARARGRRDFIILRLGLIRRPMFSADLIDPSTWTAHDGRTADDLGTRITTVQVGSRTTLELRDDGDPSADRLAAEWEAFEAAGTRLWRLSVRPTNPHLEIHVGAPPLDRSGSARLLGAVRDLAERLGPRKPADRGPEAAARSSSTSSS